MKILEVIPPPRAETIIRCEFTEPEFTLLYLAAAFPQALLAAMWSSTPEYGVDRTAILGELGRLHESMWRTANPGLAIRDRLAELFPKVSA